MKSKENMNLKQIEHDTIEKALIICNGNLALAAELLGITRYALYRKLKRNE
jgi:transcriptional regulator of acetoin/glycerol metabolism